MMNWRVGCCCWCCCLAAIAAAAACTAAAVGASAGWPPPWLPPPGQTRRPRRFPAAFLGRLVVDVVVVVNGGAGGVGDVVGVVIGLKWYSRSSLWRPQRMLMFVVGDWRASPVLRGSRVARAAGAEQDPRQALGPSGGSEGRALTMSSRLH